MFIPVFWIAVFWIQRLTIAFIFLEPAQNSVKYLTWHRTASSRSSSSRNPLGANSIDNVEDHTNNLFDNSCMISGSHASTLDRLYAWERKLYDEVKVRYISYQQFWQPVFSVCYILIICCRSLVSDSNLWLNPWSFYVDN